MVQDVLARGQRLVAAAEKTSSVALRSSEDVTLARDELDGLSARLLPGAGAVSADAATPAGVGPSDAGEETDEPDARDPRRGPMRVLGQADLIDDDEVRFHGA